MFGEKEFNLWVDEYDKMVEESAKVNKYPFAGYYDVLDGIFQTVSSKPNSIVLDLGFGTGKLTTRLYENNHIIYGQDYSNKMIELSLNKMPNAKLYEGDFSKGLVEPLRQNKYDFIISTYAFHHLKDDEKISFVKELLKYLNTNGSILIGDIMFETYKDMDDCKNLALNDWDEEENYFIVDEIKQLFPKLSFTKVTFCSGILSFTN